MNAADNAAAEAFYNSIRDRDPALRQIEGRAVEFVRSVTGYTPVGVGSFGLLLNLPDSDLDLAIGVPPAVIPGVLEELKRRTLRYKGERRTSERTTRHVFVFSMEDVDVDLGVLPDCDLLQLEDGLRRCRSEMTRQERIEHIWEKWCLKREGRREEYARLKLYPYAKFCPGFLWQPIIERY